MHSALLRIPMTLAAALAAMAMLLSAPALADQAPLSAKQKKQYKEHIKRAKAYAALDQFDKAAGEFLAAYQLDAKPPLLFNAAHAFWLAKKQDEALEQYERYLKVEPDGSGSNQARARFFEVAEARWKAKKAKKALALYETYIELAGAKGGNDVTTARRRFFQAAEALWKQGEKKAAESYYQRYLKLGDRGPSVEKARARLAKLDAERKAAADKAAEAEREKQAEIADAGDGDGGELTAGDADTNRTDRGSGRGGYRAAFWSVSAIALAGLATGTYGALSVPGYQDDKNAAAEIYQNSTGNQLAIVDGCGDAQLRLDSGERHMALEELVAACDSGASSALLANVGLGVGLVAAAAAGFLLYKAYLQSDEKSEASAAMLVPSVSPDGVGAHLLLRF